MLGHLDKCSLNRRAGTSHTKNHLFEKKRIYELYVPDCVKSLMHWTHRSSIYVPFVLVLHIFGFVHIHIPRSSIYVPFVLVLHIFGFVHIHIPP